MTAHRKTPGMMFAAFGLGGSMAAVRMACSFISIKVTAVFLGPAGLALVAQFSNFVSLFQSMLGQGLVTGLVRLSAEYGDDPARRRRVSATALRMGLALVLVLGVVLAVAAPAIAEWLLTSREHQLLIAVAGVAVAAAMLTDLLYGALGVSKEIGLIGSATIAATVLGLLIFAPASAQWGVQGGLWGSFAVLLVSAGLTVAVVRWRSRGVALSDFIGPFDRTECLRLLGFYPMLIINGVLPPLVLIMVRDTLTSAMSLDAAGLWQATWRLSEAYQAAIVSSITLYFMPSMGERVRQPAALRRQILRTLLAATGATAVLALAILLLREPIVRIVFSPRFHTVSELLPLQLLGDVLKMGGWILAMALVAVLRTRWFIAITVLAALAFVGLAKGLVPGLGIPGVLWAYVGTGLLQCTLGAVALRDILWPRHEEPPLLAAAAVKEQS